MPKAPVAVLSVLVAVVGCDAFSASDDPARALASDAGIDGPIDAASTSGIVLRGSTQFPVHAADAVVISAPAETQAGDAVLVAVGVTSSASEVTVTPPAGFDVRGTRRIQGPYSDCSWLDVAYFSSRAARGGAESYTFQSNATALPGIPLGLTAVLVAFGGVDSAQPVDTETQSTVDREGIDGGPTDSFVYTAPSVSTLTPNTELVFFMADNGGGTWANPDTGPARVTDTNVLAVFATPSPAAGKTDAPRFAVSNERCGFTGGDAKVIALRPAR